MRNPCGNSNLNNEELEYLEVQTTSTHPFVSSSATGVDRITKNATTNTIQFPIVATRSYPFGSPLIDVLGVYHAFGPGLDQEVEGRRDKSKAGHLHHVFFTWVDQVWSLTQIYFEGALKLRFIVKSYTRFFDMNTLMLLYKGLGQSA